MCKYHIQKSTKIDFFKKMWQLKMKNSEIKAQKKNFLRIILMMMKTYTVNRIGRRHRNIFLTVDRIFVESVQTNL